MNKHRNKRTELDGIKFDSQREARRYWELRLLERAGQIEGLRLQVVFEIAPSVVINGRKRPPMKYIADFVYTEKGLQVIEDSKGMVTDVYRIKRHLMKSVHGLEIREV